MQIAAQVDALVPMLYTGGGFKGYDATYGYVSRSLRLLRAAVGDGVPVHAAGGVANRMTAEELQAFEDALTDDGDDHGLEPLRPPDHDARSLVGHGQPLGVARLSLSRRQASRSRSLVARRCSGTTLMSASTGMKFVSPAQRGTTCSCRCPAIEPPATWPRFQPTLNASGP